MLLHYNIINYNDWHVNHFQQVVFQSVPAIHALMVEYAWSTIRGTGAIARTPLSEDGTVEEVIDIDLYIVLTIFFYLTG